METADSERREHDLLAGAIDRRCRDIIDRWLRQLRAELRHRNVEPTALVDGIEDYLKNVAALLRGGSSGTAGGERVWAAIAKEHAITRVRQGFDIDELIQEFVLLRKILLGVLDEEGALTNRQQIDRIVDLIEAAVKLAVRSYVEHRDYQAKRTEAEHIGFVAHELRNPLSTAILMQRQLRKVLPPATKSQEQLYDVITRSHARLRMLIDRVLLVEQLDVGEVDYRPVSTTIGEILDPVLPAIVATAQAKGLLFDGQFEPHTPLDIDPILTASAIQNLLDNAVKYTDRGHVDLWIEQRPDEIVVHVRDQCAGIPEQELKRIFEPFHRGSTHKPGTGLGLAIARRAVERQGGSIHAESAIGVGCHFWLTLPQSVH